MTGGVDAGRPTKPDEGGVDETAVPDASGEAASARTDAVSPDAATPPDAAGPAAPLANAPDSADAPAGSHEPAAPEAPQAVTPAATEPAAPAGSEPSAPVVGAAAPATESAPDTADSPAEGGWLYPTAVPVTSEWMTGPTSADVDSRADTSRLPGQHRGGFSRLPTAPVDVTVRTGPEPDTATNWAQTPQAGPQRGLAGWALMFAVLGLAVSMFVGWGFPIGLVGVASGILALRRPTENRALAGWAVVLGTASLIYSAGWLWFAASQANLFG
ncbi:hypothetical protein [Microbacterium thalassium]|uniref:DUF4190 domain-containing protein n=1 Tax=Microbacterium thalassium TaxID=362649 RepID=A0A7X0FPD0_9MICO|nr:hypothetical protein [Microbacterium thalassium]MBB6391131.1 hypothetical protein [Microbacterium thalassium]GLK23759.1 hypothetical protein GCM10017607_10770 [Microbacterium thalassium]